MSFGSSQSFEPRVGTAQLIFGIIYCFITLIALSMAFYAAQTSNETPGLQYFMAALFAVMAAKSFVIWHKVKKLVAEGVYYEAKVDSCEPVRGLTVIKGTCDVRDFGLIYIESRLVGESVAHEINRYMQEHKQDILPALVVDEKGRRPRGMFTVKCKAGHLIEESMQLKSRMSDEVKQNSDTKSEQPAEEIPGTAEEISEQLMAEILKKEEKAESAKINTAAENTASAADVKESAEPAAEVKSEEKSGDSAKS